MTKTYLINELKKVMEADVKKLNDGSKTMKAARIENVEKKFKKTRINLLKALNVYAKYGTIKSITDRMKISRKTILRYIKVCPAYGEMWEHAHQTYLDSLEEVADKRARTTSDGLLKFLLKAGRKEKYSEINNQVNINNSNANNDISPETIVTLASQIAKEIVKEQGTLDRRKIPTVIETEYKEVE